MEIRTRMGMETGTRTGSDTRIGQGKVKDGKRNGDKVMAKVKDNHCYRPVKSFSNRSEIKNRMKLRTGSKFCFIVVACLSTSVSASTSQHERFTAQKRLQ